MSTHYECSYCGGETCGCDMEGIGYRRGIEQERQAAKVIVDGLGHALRCNDQSSFGCGVCKNIRLFLRAYKARGEG